MPKIRLTQSADYCKDWGLWEGLREIGQNGQDAAKELGAPFTCTYRPDNRTLYMTNQGCTLPHSALVLGKTTKRDRSDLAGQWGEGLTIGIAALLRSGHPPTIRSGGEVWLPGFEADPLFDNEKLLMVDIRNGNKERQRVTVEVANVTPEDWAELAQRFLFITPAIDKVTTDSGDLLMEPRHKGHVFVKDIWVEYDAELTYGYNLRQADLDRDRRMIQRWSRDYEFRNILDEAQRRNPGRFNLFQMLEQNLNDIQGFGNYVNPETADQLVAEFKERHGEEAFPVLTMGQSKDLEHLGVPGIVVPAKLQAVLSRKLGTIDQLQGKLSSEVTRQWGWSELDPCQRENLERAVDLVAAVVDFSLDTVQVCSFRNQKTMGLYQAPKDDGAEKVQIGEHLLRDFRLTYETVVHEVAHRKGDDGSKAHVAEIERIHSGVVGNLLVRVVQ